MSASHQNQFVSRYLTNFFADTSEREITSAISEINPAIIQVMSTLIEHDMSIKQIVETTTKNIKKLETQIASKDLQIQKLQKKISEKTIEISDNKAVFNPDSNLSKLEKLKILRSATYNARLYLICQEICIRYRITDEPVSLRNIHREMGQSRIVHAFKPSNTPSKTSYLTHLINDLFAIKKISGNLFAVPTKLGMEIYDLGIEYYARNQIEIRFESMKNSGTLSDTKIKLIEVFCSTKSTISNTKTDRVKLAQLCDIHVDNISKYLVELVKLGFLERFPVELSNNRFTYRCYRH